MSTSAVRRNRHTARRYLWLTLFCCLFAGVYEAFSHHVISVWMISLPLYPLLLGILPFLTLKRRTPNGWARQMWHCGVATVMVGSCLTGIFEIAGIHMPYTLYFYIVGAIMLAAAIILLANTKHTSKRIRR